MDENERIQRMEVGEKFVSRPRIVTKTEIETLCMATGMIDPLKGPVPGQFLIDRAFGDLNTQQSDIVQLLQGEVKFNALVYQYDVLRTEMEIKSKRKTSSGDRVIVNYKWVLKNQDDVVCVEGENTCMYRNV